MEQGLRQRLDILSQYILKPFKINRKDVQLQFYSNLPANVDLDIDTLKLVSNGGMSLQTYLEQAETIKDADEEMKRLRAEKREQILSALKEIKNAEKDGVSDDVEFEEDTNIPFKSRDKQDLT